MKKTQYIKGKDGKFAGSIGAGKTSVPTPSPAITQPSPHTPERDLATYRIEPDDVRLNIAEELDTIPDFTHPDANITDTLLPTPPLSERYQWPVVEAQRTITADTERVINQITALNTPEPLDPSTGAPEPFYYSERQHDIAMTSWFADFHADYAQQLWKKGHYHQASAYYVMAHLAAQAADTAENNARLFRDPNFPTHPKKMNIPAVQHAIQEATTGVVVLDYLPHCGFDPDAAATWAHLLGNPHLNK